MDKKIDQLEKLKNDIKRAFPKDKIWLFPRGSSKEAEIYLGTDLGRRVNGFWGTGETPDSNRVMIIAERPSVGRGTKPKEFDKRLARFYEFLEKVHLDNSHLTDFIKTRSRIEYDRRLPEKLQFYLREFDRHLPILSKEIGIVEPNKIIAMGEKTYLWVAISKSFMNLKDTEIYYTPHYAYRFKPFEEFEMDFLRSLPFIKHAATARAYVHKL